MIRKYLECINYVMILLTTAKLNVHKFYQGMLAHAQAVDTRLFPSSHAAWYELWLAEQLLVVQMCV